jgi:uncharacterized membrane protein
MCAPADRRNPFLLIGIDPILDRRLRRWTVQSPQGRSVDWASMMTQPGMPLIIGAKRLADHV